MKTHAKRGFSMLLVLSMIVSLFAGMTLTASAAQPTSASEVNYVTNGNYVYNWGKRDTVATFLTIYAQKYYTGSYSYDTLAALSGSSSTSASDIYNSALGQAIHSMLAAKQSYTTSYNATRDLFCYTDCEESNTSKISSYYSGTEVSSTWDGGKTWNREHTWPNSKGLNGNDENDIMMLRPTSVSENSSRGNKAYGEGSSYYDPNEESSSALNLHGDVARLMLQHLMRWGNTSSFYGSSGVMESRAVLLKWMEEDPVDTWEMGRNDAVQQITGVRNVFVDYPELAFLLLGAEIPSDYTTPSGSGSASSYTITAVSSNTAWGTVSLSGKTITASPKSGYAAVGYTVSPEGAATVTQNGNTFTVSNQTADCTVTILFAEMAKVAVTVSYVVPAGVSCASTSGYAGDTLTLATPSGAPTAAPDAEFIGWSKTAVSETTEKPTALYSSLVVNSNMTFYAVYSYVNNAITYYSSDPVIHTDCDHSGGKTTTDRKEATCTESGYEKIYCADCGALLSETTLNALGHNYVDGVCTRCGEKDPNYDPEPFVCDGGKDCPSYKFSDVNAGNWYHEAVDFAVTKNLFNGMTETTFAPDTAMTRAMLVTVLYRSENTPDVSGESNPFTDVPDGQWYTDAVIWAAKEGIVNGMSETTFAPNESITREQIATILHRYAGSPKASGNLYRFSDAFSVSTYAYDAMVWAVQEGIIGGMDGALAPKDNATRAQIATILYRYLEK